MNDNFIQIIDADFATQNLKFNLQLEDCFDQIISLLDGGYNLDKNGFIEELFDEDIDLNYLYPVNSTFRFSEDDRDIPMLLAFDKLMGYNTECGTGIIGMKYKDIKEQYEINNGLFSFQEKLMNILPEPKDINIVLKSMERTISEEEKQDKEKEYLRQMEESNRKDKIKHEEERNKVEQEYKQDILNAISDAENSSPNMYWKHRNVLRNLEQKCNSKELLEQIKDVLYKIKDD